MPGQGSGLQAKRCATRLLEFGLNEPARALEIISPAGFERYFAELAPLFPPANRGPLDEKAVGAVREKYGLEMDMSSILVLAERHRLPRALPRQPACEGSDTLVP